MRIKEFTGDCVLVDGVVSIRSMFRDYSPTGNVLETMELNQAAMLDEDAAEKARSALARRGRNFKIGRIAIEIEL